MDYSHMKGWDKVFHIERNERREVEINFRPYAKIKVVLPVKRKHCLHVCDPSWLFHDFAGFYD
jgi:hypothetical protein